MASIFRAAEKALRRGRRGTLRRRTDSELSFLDPDVGAGNALLLDTCVYIDQMQGRAPPAVEDLLAIRTVNHSAVAVEELMFAVGALDPGDPRSRNAMAIIGQVVEAMPEHRIFTPDLEVLSLAAAHAGMLCRVQGYAKDTKMNALHDCVLFFQALKLGLAVLPRNLTEFDLLLQLRPEGRVLFYRV